MFEVHRDYYIFDESGERIWHTICAQCGETIQLAEASCVDHGLVRVDCDELAIYRSGLVFCNTECCQDWIATLVEDIDPDTCRVRLCDAPPAAGGICLPHINKEREGRFLNHALPCVICTLPFVPANSEGTCSDECRVEAKRLLNYRRRAREADAFVEDVIRSQIYERDDFICQLCGIEIDMTLEFPDRMSPTIDHIVPLAKNGTHEPSNVQAAHFVCNVRKGTRLNQI